MKVFAFACGLVAMCRAATVDVPLMHLALDDGDGLGVYVNIGVGTPPQTVSVLLDSGSSTLGVAGPSTGGGAYPLCTSTGGYDDGTCVVGQYDPTSSSSAQALKGSTSPCKTPVDGDDFCGFAVEYGSGCCGMEGHLYNEVLTIGSLKATVSVGSITEVQEGFQEPPANGIMGVSANAGNCNTADFAAWESGSNERTCVPDAMATLLLNNGLDDFFGMCLGNPNVPGVLSLGGPNPNFYTGDIAYTSITPGTDYYSVNLQGVGINGNIMSSQVGQGPNIVDTGTAICQLNGPAYDALESANTKCSSDSDCMVTWSIEGICVNSYGLMQCQSGTCVIDTNELSRGEEMTIIGYSAIKYFYMVFDRTAMRVGFASRVGAGVCAASCDAYTESFGCQKAGCTWGGDSCSGEPSGGNSASGSTVSSSSCAAPVSDSYNDAAITPSTDDGYASDDAYGTDDTYTVPPTSQSSTADDDYYY
eukprot:m.344616 g.344616  ORF g.344616 m.344616 type:complete len:475 (+) comp20645_c0_seq22:3514-4938(+)